MAVERARGEIWLVEELIELIRRRRNSLNVITDFSYSRNNSSEISEKWNIYNSMFVPNKRRQRLQEQRSQM